MNRPVGTDAAAAAEVADRLQAEYYLGVLTERCRDIDRRITKYQSAVVQYESRGSVDEVRRCRRMIRVEEDERVRVEWMIAALYRRFPPPGVRPATARPPAGPSPQ